MVDLEEELKAMLAAAGISAPSDAPISVCSGDLEIGVELGPDKFIIVSLSGWRQRFTLGGEDDDENEQDDEDGDDAAALALDLIGAALFGAARVVVDFYNGAARRFTLEVHGEGGWQPVSTQGARPWNPFARRTSTVHVGATPRPPRYAPVAVTPLPWAPWAGQAGFFGAAATASPAELPVDGTLDLHNFRPREVKPLVLAYIDACLARGILAVRIVHGKGVGNLRRTVHALLDRHPRVVGYRLGGHGGGSWGATLVDLSPKSDADPKD